ncbi:MAG: hypothetical protein CVV21_05885 [Candidatus Goldiibacteriota bacterium HGW-Goldbacteria-1]|jgi:iron complex outermembrane receptor protein|nr:MAG: hypothetical protein CVV21_05885 [Candidatus Goldiibacteriota bacterium HGW-Goldbacteria-1]
MLKKLMLFFLLLCITSPAFSMMEIMVEADMPIKNFNYVLGQDELTLLNPADTADAIKGITELNVVKRGLGRMQGDIMITAGTYEQAAVMLDGIRINDPQTGHYNLDIPITSLDIESIGVITTASPFSGFGAFTGLVSVQSRNISKDSVMTRGEYGSYNTWSAAVMAAKKVNDITASISAEKAGSDGYWPETDYTKNTAFFKAGYGSNTLSLAYEDKNYGAYDFYTPGKNMPSREFLITRYAALNLKPWEFLSVKPYYRYHYDKFILNNNNPSYYQNRHNTSLYGADADVQLKPHDSVEVRAKAGLRREEIQSSSFKNHYRAVGEADIAAAISLPADLKLSVEGALTSYNSTAETDFLRSAMLEWKGLEVAKLYAGCSESSRYPSFTELYYNDPYTAGNDALKPERSLDLKTGFDMEVGAIHFSVEGLYRYSTDLIDWGKNDPSDAKWAVDNIGRVNTGSVTSALKMPFAIFNISAGHTYTDSYASSAYISKYGANYLRNKFFASVDFELYGFITYLSYMYKSYDDRKDAYNGFDASVSYTFMEIVTAVIKCENLANMYYEEIIGIPAPGRVLKVIVSTQF